MSRDKATLCDKDARANRKTTTPYGGIHRSLTRRGYCHASLDQQAKTGRADALIVIAVQCDCRCYARFNYPKSHGVVIRVAFRHRNHTGSSRPVSTLGRTSRRRRQPAVVANASSTDHAGLPGLRSTCGRPHVAFTRPSCPIAPRSRAQGADPPLNPPRGARREHRDRLPETGGGGLTTSCQKH